MVRERVTVGMRLRVRVRVRVWVRVRVVAARSAGGKDEVWATSMASRERGWRRDGVGELTLTCDRYDASAPADCRREWTRRTATT